MGLTYIVVTGDFSDPDGETPTGEVVFNLSGTLSDPSDAISVPARVVTATLDVNGKIAVPLAANDPGGLVPSSDYWVSERIEGAPERAYYATVPAVPTGARSVADAVATKGLTTLTSPTAAFTSNDVGAYVFCPAAFPVPVRIDSVMSSTLAVLSTAATATASGLSVLIGASVDLATRRPL